MIKKCSVVQFWLRPVWSPRRPIFAALRYQLIARATYLRCATVSVGRYSDLSPASPPVALIGNAGWFTLGKLRNQVTKQFSAAARRMKKSGPLDAAEDRGNFTRGRAQALALCAQGRIERNIIRVRSQNFLDQLTVRSEPRMMRMRGGSPVAQKPGAGGWLGPKQAAVFEPGQILVTGVFAQGIHGSFSPTRRAAYQAVPRASTWAPADRPSREPAPRAVHMVCGRHAASNPPAFRSTQPRA